MNRTISLILSVTISGLIIITSCKKNEPEPVKNNTVSTSSATINGTEFKPTTLSANHNGSDTSGYLLSFTDGASIVTISTKSKTGGTYSICSNCRLAANDSASAFVTTGGNTYKATSGTITITVATDGTIGGTYTFDAISASNITISIKDGKFEGITVTQVSPEEYMKSVLTSKDWIITTYQDGGFGDLKQADNCWSKMASSSPDGPGCPEVCAKFYNWKTYMAHFTPTTLYGTFFYEESPLDSISTGTCTPHYSKASKTEAYTSTYTYNSTEKTLLINFGNIYDLVDDAHSTAFTNWNYNVTSVSTHKVVLEGSAVIEGKSLTRKIVLE